MIEITAIRLDGGDDHTHITDVLWRSAATFAGHSTLHALVEWLSSDPANQAVLECSSGRLDVTVRRPAGEPVHVRAHQNGRWTDDLLSLPRF